jgi:hypothetical protein
MLLLLAGSVIAFVVVFVVLLSNATFTSKSESRGNSLAAGTTSLSLSASGRIINADDMKPGDSRQGNISVTNTGERARLSVTPTGLGGAPALAQAMTLKISERDAPGTVKWNGPLANAGRVDLGPHQTDETSAWTFELTLPAGSDSSLRGAKLDAGFEWEARSP